MTNNNPEERAFNLLQWVSYSLPSEFDEELASSGFYTKLQAERSDKALDAWETEHPHESSQELAAFKELVRLKVYSEQVFFSPQKAKDGGYSRRIKEHARGAEGSPGSAEPARRPRKRRSL